MSSLGAAMDVRFGTDVEAFLDTITGMGLDHIELKREYLEGHPDTPSPSEMGDLADEYGVSITYHAPFRDWNMGSFNDAAREDAVGRVKRTLDDAAAAGAGAVVVHGGAVPERYPRWVRETAVANAERSLAECAEYAQFVGVPLCLENQPIDDQKRRHTTTPADLEAAVDRVDVLPESLGITLDVGHAKVNGYHWRDFVDRFGDRITVCHLHDNGGTGDQHEPLPDYQRIVETVPADYFVFEMKSVADIARCMRLDPEPFESVADPQPQ